MLSLSAPVHTVFFMSGSNATFDGATTWSSDVIESRDPREDGAVKAEQLTFVAGLPSYLACVAVGGYPPPQVRVHLGQVYQLSRMTARQAANRGRVERESEEGVSAPCYCDSPLFHRIFSPQEADIGSPLLLCL